MNKIYANVCIDMSVLDEYPADDIPEALMMAAKRADEKDGADAGYAPNDPAQDPQLAKERGEEVDVLDACGVCDASGERVPVAEQEKAAVSMMSGKPFRFGEWGLSINHASSPSNEYDTAGDVEAYPDMFPFGAFGARHHRADNQLTADDFISLCLNHIDQRFERHPFWVFHTLNIQVRKWYCGFARMSTSKTVHPNQGEIVDISPADIKQYGELLVNGGPVPPKLDALRKLLRLSTANIPGTRAVRERIRHESFALTVHHGLPNMMITINPSDNYHPLSILIAGKTIDMDCSEHPKMAELRERTSLLQKNPVRAAKFFHLFMRATITHLLGCDSKGPVFGSGPATTAAGGVLGHIVWYNGCVEFNRGGKPHSHIIAMIAGIPFPGVLKQRLGELNEDYITALCQCLDSLVQNQLPLDKDGGQPLLPVWEDGYTHGDPDIFPQVQPQEPHPACAHPLFLKECRTTGGRCRSGTTEEALTYKLNKDAHTYRLVYMCQWHGHTFTCYKKSKNDTARRVGKAMKGNLESNSEHKTDAKQNDLSCRFHFPRQIVLNTRVKFHFNMTQETYEPTIELRRLDSRVNGTNHDLLIGTQCNTDISLFFAAKQVLKAIIYGSHYSSKPQAVSAHISSLCVALEKLQAEEKAAPEKFAKPSEHCRRFLIRILTGQEGLQERGAVEAAALLLGLPEQYVSHKFRKLVFSNVLYYLEQSAGFPDLRKETFTATHHKGSTTWANQRIDYWCRGEALQPLCLYEYALRVQEWTRNAAAKASLHMYDYDNAHPRSDSHCQVITGYEVIPCLVGPTIPARSKEGHKHERIALVLFRPHVTAEDLLPEYDAMCQMSSVRVRHWLEKMDVMSQTEAGDEKVGEQEHSTDETKLEGCNEDPDVEQAELAANDAAALDAMTAVDLMNQDFPNQSNVSALQDACGMSVQRHTVERPIHNENTSWDPVKNRAGLAATAELAALCVTVRDRVSADAPQQAYNADDVRADESRSPPPAEVLALANIQDLVADVARKWTLNEEQRLALRLAALAFDGSSPPIRAFVCGPAGTGKTRVVRACQELAQLLGKKMLTSCPTGVAADVVGGSTMHQTFAIQKKVTADLDLKLTRQLAVDLFIIDEVSMVGAILLRKVDCVLRRLFSADEMMGGKNVMYMGDFLQLPCVKDVSLFSLTAKTTNAKAVAGLLLWNQLSHSVRLQEQMRQADDPLYFDCMLAFREGWLQENHKLCLSSVALLPGDKVPAEFEECTRIVATNSLRQALNRMFVRKLASAGKQVTMYMAEDVGPQEANCQRKISKRCCSWRTRLPTFCLYLYS